MKITYDKATDAVYIRFNNTTSYHITKKVTDDVLVDYSKSGKVLGLEVLSASKNMQLPKVRETISLRSI